MHLDRIRAAAAELRHAEGARIAARRRLAQVLREARADSVPVVAMARASGLGRKTVERLSLSRDE
jgi:hypothetical protein